MTAKNNYTYEVAFKELQEIVQQIEIGDVDIDQLSNYIKRAATLVKICEAKLSKTEEEVQSLLKKLNEEEESSDVIDDEEKNKVEEEQEEDYEATHEEDLDSDYIENKEGSESFEEE